MLSKIIGIAIMCMSGIYVWSKLYNEKPDFKSYRLYIGYIIMVGLISLCNFQVVMYIKIVSIVSVFSIINWYIFRKRFKEIIISSLVCELIAILSETVFAIVVIFVLYGVDFEKIMENFFGSIITNIAITILIVAFSQVKLFKKLYQVILKYTDKINISQFLLIIAIFVVSYNLLFFIVYSPKNLLLSIIICSLTTIVYAFIVFKIVQTQNNYLAIFIKYNSSLDSLKQYEKMIDLYKVSNHENKNQLLTIRNMFKEKDKSISEYIDTVIDNKLQDDKKLRNEAGIIPEGGLRAVIYSKLLDMKSKKIKYNLNVDKKLKAVQLIELDDAVMLDICKIVGVLLDNAIDAVTSLKDAMIDINLHISDDKLYVIISNNFEGSIDIEKIGNKKYTTKGEGHGYGLSLVKQIIDKNNRLYNIRKINDDVFIQELQIKM